MAGLSLSADLVVLGRVPVCQRARVERRHRGADARVHDGRRAQRRSATLWDVSDQATARVMTRFYAGYLTGASKDRALRSAQLALLRDLRAGRVTRKVGDTTLKYAEHPHLWAGAILIGAP